MNDRKNIIISFKSNYGERKKGIEKRIQYLKGMSILNLVLTLLCGGILISSIISELFGYTIFRWEKTGLLAILSLSFVLNLPNELYELKLLNHLKKINSKPEFNGIDKLNSELKKMIDKLNNRFKNNWSVIVLAILILIMGIWQMGFDNNNPYWNYMKLPILVFYGIIIFRFIITNRKLNENIEKTEKYCS
ncbi:hypothetical protein H0I31_00630 [Tenacibaculum sp. AHE15PA]|uniref:hypothetical protein n=1 Tax=unclassified Tenacibaculum TaxID=2635139 RepID=UPI001C4E594E|nr:MULTISPECIES: hypothetical protein [unclassified Tenacibaculum]QXP72357.1 hypothetical protein H0I30_05890 [Tenacibaculum sp. AHE14PA]QXP74862.1 hypothetical protein H0I31_00630 [Tenacibaculum sp. AHE15PA]